MKATRRTFLGGMLAAGALAACRPGPRGGGSTAGGGPAPAEKKTAPLKLLILGGTGFLGPAIVEAALPRGHVLTLFNRGKTNPHLFPELEKLHGDRANDLKALEGRRWDAVIDTSGYVPRHVTMSAELLAPNVRQYLFVSTISVYSDGSKIGMDETSPVGTLPDPTVEEVGPETYGPLKALCEQAAEKAMPGRVANVRPGLIVGPRDRSDRFTYWPVRVARGGEVLAPGTGDDPVQIIDVRDLAEWLVHVAEQGVTGVYNALGPAERLTMRALLDACKTASGSDATFTWVDATFLAEKNVRPWMDMPAWIPPEPDSQGMTTMSNARAIEKGLRFRPILDTARDTLGWWNGLPAEERARPMRAGLTAEREAEVLGAWKARGPA